MRAKVLSEAGLYLGLDTSVHLFLERLNDLKRYFLYFTGQFPEYFDTN
jgi:hypothetical protein